MTAASWHSWQPGRGGIGSLVKGERMGLFDGPILYSGGTTKDGPAGASTPVIPGLTPDTTGGSP